DNWLCNIPRTFSGPDRQFDGLARQHPELFPPEEKIEFCFDEQGEKRQILRMWDEFCKASGERFQERIGRVPRFESDTYCMPLQAADFWAWWNSHWMDTGKTGFEAFEPKRHFPSTQHIVTENGAVSILKRVIWSNIPGATIYDHRIPGGDTR